MILKIKRDEAMACTIKYLSDDSVEYIFFVLFMRGIIQSILISSPIHIVSHEYEEIVINILNINEIKNINFQYLKFIKKKRIRTFISGV